MVGRIKAHPDIDCLPVEFGSGENTGIAQVGHRYAVIYSFRAAGYADGIGIRAACLIKLAGFIAAGACIRNDAQAGPHQQGDRLSIEFSPPHIGYPIG